MSIQLWEPDLRMHRMYHVFGHSVRSQQATSYIYLTSQCFSIQSEATTWETLADTTAHPTQLYTDTVAYCIATILMVITYYGNSILCRWIYGLLLRCILWLNDDLCSRMETCQTGDFIVKSCLSFLLTLWFTRWAGDCIWSLQWLCKIAHHGLPWVLKAKSKHQADPSTTSQCLTNDKQNLKYHLFLICFEFMQNAKKRNEIIFFINCSKQ